MALTLLSSHAGVVAPEIAATFRTKGIIVQSRIRIIRTSVFSLLAIALLASCGAQVYKGEPQSEAQNGNPNNTNENRMKAPIGIQVETNLPQPPQNTSSETHDSIDSVPSGTTLFLGTAFRVEGRLAGSNAIPVAPDTFTDPANNVIGNTFVIDSIKTDNILKIAVAADGLATKIGTRYQYAYSCIKLKVTVGDSEQTAFVSTTGQAGVPSGPCAGAQPRPVLDFSSQAGIGHDQLTASYKVLSFDNCASFTGNMLQTGCPLKEIRDGVQVTARTWIFVNGSVAGTD